MITSVDKTAPPLAVLLLDDDTSIRQVVSHALAQSGCRVEAVANGRLGLRMLLTRTFDVAVVDVRMHEMDGLTFIQEAKKIWPWLGFVIISGSIDDHVRLIADREGIIHLMAKPLDMPALVQAVRSSAKSVEGAAGPAMHDRSRELIAYQLTIMRHMSRNLLTTRELFPALANLGQAIAEMVPYHVMGILGVEEQESLLLVQSAEPVSESNLAGFRRHIIDRYQALSGRSLNTATLRIEYVGSSPDAGHPDAGEIQSMVSVPLITGDEVHGLLTLGSRDPHLFDEGMIAILYHAAGILATTLTAIGELQHQAIHDALTGLFNRRHFEEELQRTWQLSCRYKHPMALMIMDVDLFKEINDRWGHRAGDDLIRAFVQELRNIVRASDVLARYGGDEFVIILPRASEQEATALSQRMLDAIRGKTFRVGDQQLSVTISIGMAVQEPEAPAPHYEELLHRADEALLRAKRFGRNTALVWHPDAARVTRQPFGAKSMITGKREYILAMDDDEAFLRVLVHILGQKGYQVDVARTAAEARDLLKTRRTHYSILLGDISLPDGDGLEMIRKVHDADPSLITIVISGHATTENAIHALRHGAFDFIPKPIIADTLVAAIERALRYRSLLVENSRYRDYLEEMVRIKHSEVVRGLDEIKQSYTFALETIVAMLDAREFETGQHSIRVRDLTLVLAYQCGFRGRDLEEMGRGALLHDIGKIGVPDSILLKQGDLNEYEWSIIRSHPEIGYRFLKNSTYFKTAAGIVLSHHERWDGTGYPHRVKGEAIDRGARIFSVIDAYDAMRSPRVYKNSMSREAALTEIKEKSGTQFDPSVVSAFLACVDELERIGCWRNSDSGG